jgi:hypothetical protein
VGEVLRNLPLSEAPLAVPAITVGRTLSYAPSISDRVLDILVAEIGLQSPCIVALISQSKSAGMSEHVRVSLEAQRGSLSSLLHHLSKAGCGEG